MEMARRDIPPMAIPTLNNPTEEILPERVSAKVAAAIAEQVGTTKVIITL